MSNHLELIQSECTKPDEHFTEEFVKKIEKICLTIVHGKPGNRQEIIADVAQQTLLRLWEHRHSIDFSSGQIWGYARTIALNVLIDFDKKGKIDGSKLVRYRPSDKLPENYELPSIDYELLLDDLLTHLSDVDKIIIQKKIEGYEMAKDIVPFLKDFRINDPSAVTKRLKKLEDRIKKLIRQGE
jgi:DNA-directed RNA polymerase specialized sigma24 family protein